MNDAEIERNVSRQHRLYAIAAICLILIPTIPIVWQLAINVPADVAYQNKFGGYVALAVTGPPDFAGIKTNILQFYSSMNSTFPQSTWATTYNSWFPWDRTYDNSMVAQNQYLHHLLLRIDYYQAEINKTGATQYTDVYDQYIKNLRSEINSSGHLDWVVHGAWLLQFAPLTYFFGSYMLIVVTVLFLIAFFFIWKATGIQIIIR